MNACYISEGNKTIIPCLFSRHQLNLWIFGFFHGTIFFRAAPMHPSENGTMQETPETIDSTRASQEWYICLLLSSSPYIIMMNLMLVKERKLGNCLSLFQKDMFILISRGIYYSRMNSCKLSWVGKVSPISSTYLLWSGIRIKHSKIALKHA